MAMAIRSVGASSLITTMAHLVMHCHASFMPKGLSGMKQKHVHRLKLATLVFKGTSGDLLFWALIDTLFLTQVNGFTVTEVSLIFTVAFWVALPFKSLSYGFIRKMKVSNALIWSAILFLASSLLITFGPTLPFVMAGQCLYVIAPVFYEVSGVLLKELCKRDTAGKDFVESSSLASTLYSSITLIAALLISPLMTVNPYLPMIICIAMRVFSLVLAIGIGVSAKDFAGLNQRRKPILKGRYFDRSTVSYLFMAAFFGAFCSLSVSYLKLLLQDNLAAVFSETAVVTAFSACIIATRVVKVFGNRISGGSKTHGIEYVKLCLLLAGGGIIAVSFGLVGVMLTGIPAVGAAAIGLLFAYLIFDPMFDVLSFLTIENLNDAQCLTAIYTKGLLRDLVSAVVSSIITAVLAVKSYAGVMVLLILMALVVLYFGVIGKRYHNLKSWDYILSWPTESVENHDSLMVAAAVLMVHYGAVQNRDFNPAILEERAGTVEQIGSFYQLFRYVGKRPYVFDEVCQSFSDGEPSAVLGSRNGVCAWYPVLYLDEDDGVTLSHEEGPLFLSDLDDIREQCLFSAKPKYLARSRA